MKRPPQPDLFAPPVKPRNLDERRLVQVLRQPARAGTINGMTPERMRRCFPPRLPRVTVPK